MLRTWPDLVALLALLYGLWHAGPVWPIALLALVAWAGLLAVRLRLPGGPEPFTAWMQLLVAAFFLTLRFLLPTLHLHSAGSIAVAAGLFHGILGLLVVLVRQMPWETRPTGSGERRARQRLGRWLVGSAVVVVAGGLLLPGRWPMLTLALAAAGLLLAAGAVTAAAARPR